MLEMEDIIGLEVVSEDARVVGIVEGVGLDVEEWKIPLLRVALKKGVEDTVRVKKPLFSSAKLHIRTSGVESISDTVTLKVKMSDVRSISVEEGTVFMTAADIIGKMVICRKGRDIGFAHDVIFIPEKDWSVPQIEVKLDKYVLGDLKLKKSLLSSPIIRIQTSDIKTVGDIIMLKIDHEELKDFLEKKTDKKAEQNPGASKSATEDMPGYGRL